MVYKITNENLIVHSGGHATIASVQTIPRRGGGSRVVSAVLGPGRSDMGSQRHYPIFTDETGEEYISFNGQTLQKISSFNFPKTRRETVSRG
jgi:hypothetical protein